MEMLVAITVILLFAVAYAYYLRHKEKGRHAH